MSYVHTCNLALMVVSNMLVMDHVTHSQLLSWLPPGQRRRGLLVTQTNPLSANEPKQETRTVNFTSGGAAIGSRDSRYYCSPNPEL